MKQRILPGQTIIEMLVVFFIISVGLYGAVTLIFSNLMLQEIDEDHIVAMNLARESLELVQNVRDSNWLASLDFDEGLGTDIGADCTAVPDWDGITFGGFDFTPNTMEEGILNRSRDPASYDMFTNQYGSSTSYARLITFAPICADPTDRSQVQASEDCICPPDAGHPTYTEKIGVRAEAQVGWERRGRRNSIRVYTDLYDWR